MEIIIDIIVKFIMKTIKPYLGLPKEAYIVALSRFINAMGTLVGPILVFILTDKIGYSSEQAGNFLLLSGLAMVIPAIIGGKLVDSIGRKPVLVIFESIGLSTYFICGFIEPNLTLVYLLITAGAFYAFTWPAHDAILADISNKDNRKRIYSLGYLGFNLGFAVGAALAGILYSNDMLNLIFFGDALTTLLALGLIVYFIKETKSTANDEEVSKEEQPESQSIVTVLIRRPYLIVFTVVMIGLNFVYSQWSFTIPLNLKDIFTANDGAKYFGYLGSFNGVIVILFTPIITYLMHKFKNTSGIVIGGLLYTIGFGMLSYFYTLPFFFVSIFIMTLGEIVLAINVNPYIMNHTPSSHRGRMSSIIGIMMGSGFLLGPVISGKLLMEVNFSKVWLIIGSVALISSLLMYTLYLGDKETIVEGEELEDVM